MGAGTGSAGTGTTTALIVNQTTTVAGLYPGGPVQALSGTFNNPNAGPVAVGIVSATVTATSVTNCLPAWYKITGLATPSTQVVPTGTTKGSWSGLNVAMLDDPANQDVCKNATITITYAVAAS
jgi:hypothetical protein